MRRRRWTDDQLRRAAEGADSMAEVASRLGLWQSGPTNRVLYAHAARLGIALPNGWYRRDRSYPPSLRRDRSVPNLPPPLRFPTPLGRPIERPVPTAAPTGRRKEG